MIRLKKIFKKDMCLFFIVFAVSFSFYVDFINRFFKMSIPVNQNCCVISFSY